MIRPALLMSAQQVVAKTLTGEGIRVRWDATVPHADLKNRVMHLRPLPDQISARELQDVRADCDHELAHFLFTDLTALEGVDRSMVKVLTNAIEDGLIERKLSGRYLGCAENLLESNSYIFKEMRARASRDTRRGRAMTALMLFTRGSEEEQIYELLGDDFKPYIEMIRDLLPSLAAVAMTADSVTLATEIADRWKWDAPEPPEAGNGTRGEIDEDGEEEQAELLETSAAPSIRKSKIEKMTFTRSRVYRARTEEDTEELLSGAPTVVPPENISAEFMNAVRQVAAPLRRRLLMEFRGPGRRVARHQRRGRLDQRSLHKVALADEHVFEAEIKDIVIDRDVTLMVDCSGSMLTTGDEIAAGRNVYNSEILLASRLAIASKAAAACALVLDLIGVPNEVLGWTTHERGVASSHYERVTPLRHLVVKPADASFRSCRQNFVRLAAFGGCRENVDGESLLWGAQRLAARARRNSRRPVLIVFSDGDPLSSPEDRNILASHLESSVSRIIQAGVSLVGVGIQSNAGKRFYPSWVSIEELNDLVGRFYVLLREVIAGNLKNSA